MKPYFRPGVGAVIYNQNGQILIFSRADNPDIWQFPQGGIDLDESLDITLWRELKEETALVQANFNKVTEFPHWTVYSYPDEIKYKLQYQAVLGQVHRWYFLQIDDQVQINLDLASDKEFKDFRWSTFEDLLSQNDRLKHEIYQELYKFFTLKIIPT